MSAPSRSGLTRRRAHRMRLARLPGPVDIGRFVRHLRQPTRSSVVRAFVDGVFVTWTLHGRGVHPLVPLSNGPTRQDVERSIQVSEAVDIGFGLIPVAPTCLRRSMTLVRELHRLGLASTLHIGVRRAGRIEAHAWVQVGDVVVNDDAEEVATYTDLAPGESERLLRMLR
jgi:Transglutaminase-like superfamily